MFALDVIAIHFEAWLYALIASLIGFIFTGALAAGDQNIVMSSFLDPNLICSPIPACQVVQNIQPAVPNFIILLSMFVIVSVIIVFRNANTD
jgi:hypothetical protein